MPTTERRRRSFAVLRTFGLVAALACGAVAIWLIVTSTTQPKRIEVGVLVGLWGLLLGAYSMFGSRARAAAPVAAAPPAPPPSQELDLRKIGEIETAAVAAAVAAARREFRAELEEMLRREVQAGLAPELAGLRAEVAALRNELVEKVGGQLRLERIETTRLIGSDLEALQHELRRLREIGGRDQDADAAEVAAAPAADVHDAEIVVERVDPVPQRAAAAEPAPQPEPRTAAEAEPQRAPEPAPQPEPQQAPPPAGAPEPASGPAPEPEPEAQPPGRPAAQPAAQPVPQPVPQPVAAGRPDREADPFASMPRIRPFTDFELDPTPPTNGDVAARTPGRHSSADGDAGARSGRRHRADDDANDVLARILARETQA